MEEIAEREWDVDVSRLLVIATLTRNTEMLGWEVWWTQAGWSVGRKFRSRVARQRERGTEGEVCLPQDFV